MEDSPRGAPYHWVLSVSGSIRGRQATAGFNGDIETVQGQTRSQVYDHLRGWVLGEIRRQTGSSMDSPATVFFSLEPDRL